MKMIIGLGNPGKEYEKTRHNVGFMVVDHYAHNKNVQFKEKFNGLSAKINYKNEIIILLKPLSYMNLSGTVIKKYIDFYKINYQDILVIQDDLDMPVGKIKLKYKGSCGGHNGIRNIIDNLKTEEFKRFKLGIGKNANVSTKDYVLGKFSSEEQDIINKIILISDEILDSFITNDFEKAMSKYNGAQYEIN